MIWLILEVNTLGGTLDDPMKEVADLILLSKSMIDRIRIQFNASPDSHTLAASVLLAHDSAELALAAIANQTGQLPTGSRITGGPSSPMIS